MREQVLALVGRYLTTPLRPSGGSNYLTKCPFHKGGQETKPSFSINVEKGVFHCFTCHEAGGLGRFLHLLRVPRDRIDSELAGVKPLLERAKEHALLAKTHVFGTKGDPFEAPHILPESIMGVYDHMPETLVADGFSPELLRKLEVGFDRTAQRVMWPLRDMYGNLYGFSGGTIRKDVFPKYKVYQGTRTATDGRTAIKGDFGDWFDERFPGYTCENHRVIWNFDVVWPMVLGMSDPWVILCEGFKAATWLMQAGFLNVVALMGSYISDQQQLMLHRLGCNVVLFMDNDDAGRDATFRIGNLLWKPMYGRLKVVQYPWEDFQASLYQKQNTQPDDYEADAVRELVYNRSVQFTQYYQQMRSANVW